MRFVLLLLLQAAVYAQRPDPAPYKPTAEETAAIRSKMTQLEAQLKKLAPKHKASDMFQDVAVCHKAADWILRHPEEFLTKAYYDNTLKVLDLGTQRAGELASGNASWPTRKGRAGRAYLSKVDQSVQPYTVIVPDTYSGQPMRLDLVLHGRNARMNEVSFLADAEFGKPPITQPDRIELHVYGRTNNAYRWAGETDVFEALDAVKRNYKIDDAKIVLRGFSMGGAGTWHIGLHHPYRWAATEAGAGFSETRKYAKAENAPYHEQRSWPIYDSYLYARNAMLVPTVGYGSVDDPQLLASTNIKEQLANENLQPWDVRALFLIGPAIGHKYSPDSKKISEEYISRALAEPRLGSQRIQFVTHTAKYGKAGWIEVDGLERHYDRAEIDAVRGQDAIRVSTINVSHVKLAQSGKVVIDGKPLEGSAFAKTASGWTVDNSSKQLRKRHGLQGPIDDAFMDGFVCVKGSGDSPRLDTFRANWDKFLRGDLVIKSDKSVSDADIRSKHLVLFGDAASNKLIAKVLPKMPVKWTRNEIQIAGKTFTGEGLVLIAIYPNPLNPAKYVVLNSGHTFGEKEFKGTNALLYPRLGDWAVLRSSGELVAAGFFNEQWQ